MKTPILIGMWVVILFGTAEVWAEKNDASPRALADDNMPETIACAQDRGESLGRCSYLIKRDETGRTTVTVVFANGFQRRLFFQDGQFVKAGVTMSGVGTDSDWNLTNGTHMIRVEGQRYEVPDSLIAGN